MALRLGDIIVRLGLDTGQFSREMRAAQRQLQAAGGGFRQVGQAATMAISVPLAAAGLAALKFAADFDAAMTQSMAIMSEFSASSELTAQGQEALRGEMEQVARTVSKELNLAAADAAKSFFFLTSAGMDAQQSMAALPQVAAFAKAGMFDFATATDLATDAQSALGLKSQDVAENLAGLTRVTDVLVGANMLANASTEQFATALTTKAGAALKVANKSIEEGVAVLAVFADQGIKAQNAGTALQIVLRDLSTKAINNKEAFETAGVAVFDAENNYRNMADIIGDLENALDGMSDAQKKATLLQLGFTDKSVIFLQTLLGSSNAMREFQTRLEDMGGVTKEVAEQQLKAFNEQLGLLQKRVVDAAISVGSKILPVILDFIVAIEPLIVLLEDAARWFSNWPEPLRMAAVALVALAAAGGPLLIFIGFVTQSVAALIAIWPAIVTAFTFMTATVIPAIIGAFQAMAVYIAGTLIPAIGSLAVAMGPALLYILGAAAAAFVAFELTSWILEVTGAQEALDRFADSLFNVQRTAEGVSMPTFLSEEDLRLIDLAEEKMGRVFARTAEGRREAVAAMTSYNMAIREGATATEAMATVSEHSFDAMDRFADAMGVSRERLDLVASRLGMTTQALFDNAKRSALVTAELKKMAAEAVAAEKRLRNMVKTVRDAEKEAQDLAKAVELEGGAMALTREETLRLASMIEVLTGNNIEVAESLKEVTERARELERAEREAAIAEHALAMAHVDLRILNDALNASMEAGTKALETQLVITEEMIPNVTALGQVMGVDLTSNVDTAGDSFANFGSIMQDVAAIFQVFGISAESGIGQAIAAVSGLVSQIPSILDFSKSVLGAATTMSEKFAAGAQGVAAGAASIGAFTAQGTTASRAAKGAVAGAGAGAFAGPWGAAIGAGIGALVGWFRGRGMAKAQKQISQMLGQQVSEALGQAIRDTAKEADISVQTAALLHLGDAFAEAGGIAEFGMKNATLAIMNLIDFTVQGEIPMTTGLAHISEAFITMAQSSMEAGGIATTEMFEIIKAAERLGEEVPAIAEFIAASVEQAVAGVAGIVGQKIEGEEMAFGGLQVTSQEDAQAQATIFSTTFFAAIEEMGLRAAVEALGPAFDVLKEKIEGFGAVDMGGMERFFDIARDPQFGPLLDGVQGLSDALAGAANAGFLTHDMFNAIQHQGLSAFDQLLAAGLTEQEALQQMGPLLQNMIDASNQYGMALDPATAALVEQAEAAGVAFSADPMYVMADAMLLVATLLGATDEQLSSIGETASGVGGSFAAMASDGQAATEEIAAAAGASADELENQFADSMRETEGEFGILSETAKQELELIASYSGEAIESVASIGDEALLSANKFNNMEEAAQKAGQSIKNIPGPSDGDKVEHFQHGGLVTRPTLALIGEEGPELVIPARDLGQAIAREPTGAGDLAGGARAPTMNFDFSGAVVGDPHRLSQLIGEAVGIALETNEGEAGTKAKNFLDTRA